MLVGNKSQVVPQPATMPGVKGAAIQWLVAAGQGAENFYMRRIIVEKDGFIPVHTHPEEHEIYVLTGQGQATREGEAVTVGPGDFLFIPGGEPHGFVNQGTDDLTFICCINVVKG
ncbi:MAG: cupin domain-containing protein [Pseudomonadota bacterium]